MRMIIRTVRSLGTVALCVYVWYLAYNGHAGVITALQVTAVAVIIAFGPFRSLRLILGCFNFVRAL